MIKKYIIIVLLSLGLLSASFAFTMESYRFNNNGCLVKEVSNFNQLITSSLVIEDSQLLAHREPCLDEVTKLENENLLKNTLSPTKSRTICKKEFGTNNIVCETKELVDYEKSKTDITIYSFKSMLRDPVTPCCGN